MRTLTTVRKVVKMPIQVIKKGREYGGVSSGWQMRSLQGPIGSAVRAWEKDALNEKAVRVI